MKIDDLSLEVALCKSSFEYFVKQFWEMVPGAGKVTWNWHMSVFCDELQKIAERVFKGLPKDYDLVVNVSPGTSKSTIFSILFHPWTWTRMPNARHLCASHTESLALDLAGKARDVIVSEKYREYFPDVKIRKDRDSKGDYANTAGGDRLTCTVAGKTPTGRHGIFLYADDPIDPKKALSELELKVAREFMTNVFPSRKVDKLVAVIFLVMQRLHETDPTGVMLEQAKLEGHTPVRHVCLPAELSDHVKPVELKKFYVDGLMDPKRLSMPVLKSFRATMGEYGYDSQFLQNPAPIGGGIFKEEYFNVTVKAAPHDSKRIRFWDRASLSRGGARTAGVLLARGPDQNFYIEHMLVGQWEPFERNQKIKAIALRDRAKYGPRYEPQICIERELGSSGKDAFMAIARELAGFCVIEVGVSGDKEIRAGPWSAQLAAGTVRVVTDGTWDVNEYIREHCLFPNGRWCDLVDASTGAFNKLMNIKHPGTVRALPIGRNPNKNLPRVVVSSKQAVEQTIIEETSLCVNIMDPLSTGFAPVDSPAPIGLIRCLGCAPFAFADIEPANYQDCWEEPLEGYGRPPAEVILSMDIGKKIWAFLLRKRDPSPSVYVFLDDGDHRALAVACAFCDSMHLPRTIIHRMGETEPYLGTEAVPNKHVYEITKASRHLVI